VRHIAAILCISHFAMTGFGAIEKLYQVRP
jgi:hypothetical protein